MLLKELENFLVEFDVEYAFEQAVALYKQFLKQRAPIFQILKSNLLRLIEEQ